MRGWGEREVQEEDLYIQLIQFVVQQKLTQHDKAIMSQIFFKKRTKVDTLLYHTENQL